MVRQNGTNCGYLSTSATRLNMLTASCRTRRLVVNCGILSSGARRLEPGEILARVVRGTRERRRCHHGEAFRVGDRLQRLELVGRHVADDRVMLARRLQVLDDGEKVDLGRAQ